MLLSVLLNRSSGFEFVRERGHFIINFARGEKLQRSIALFDHFCRGFIYVVMWIHGCIMTADS